jgi:Bacterial sugar transferase/CoA-binding domain
MIRLFKHYVPYAVLFLAIVDLCLLIAAAETAWVIRANQIGMAVDYIGNRIWPLVTFAASVQLAAMAVGVYSPESLQSLRFAIARLLVAVSLGVIFMAIMAFALPGMTLWRSNSLYAMCLSFAYLALSRMILGSLIGGESFKRRLLVLGAGKRAQRIKDLEARRGSGFVVVGYIAMDEAKRVIPEAINRSAIYNLADFVVKLGASEVVLALEERRNALPLQDLLRIKTTGVHVNDISSFLERETGRVDLDSVNPSWLIFSDGFSSGRRLSGIAKRLFDIVASALLVALTLPVILLFALIVKLESKGPAFYRQQRVGRYGVPFNLVKLRSMRVDAEVEGKAVWAAKDDPRITRVGKFIPNLSKIWKSSCPILPSVIW